MNKSSLLILSLLTLVVTACGASATQDTPTATQNTLASMSSTPASTLELITTPTSTEPLSTVTPGAPGNASVSFSNDVMPILQSRCFNCHGGEQTKKGLSFTSYETIMAGSDDGQVIIPGDANGSLLIQQLLNGKMPPRGPKLTPEQVQILIDWILAGALNN